MRAVWLAFLLAGLSACRVANLNPATARVFMSPRGADVADGLTPSTSVATLERALEISIAAAEAGATQIAIEVGEGTYRGQRATITERPEGTRFVIRPNRSDSKVIFDGAGKGGVWLVVRPSAGAGVLSINDLAVVNYVTAISLSGSRDNPSQPVEGVEIVGNEFRGIGQIALPRSKPSTAVVRLVNADRTRIVDNLFIDMKNVQKCGLLHAIYLAHGSTENRIESNRFERGCGDAIRIRDRSNYNVIRRNTFVDAWAVAPVSDWYCNGSVRDDCTKLTPECPSIGNVLAGNTVIARKTARAELMKSFNDRPNCNCLPDNAPRFITE